MAWHIRGKGVEVIPGRRKETEIMYEIVYFIFRKSVLLCNAILNKCPAREETGIITYFSKPCFSRYSSVCATMPLILSFLGSKLSA
jgi:hypothetical protein